MDLEQSEELIWIEKNFPILQNEVSLLNEKKKIDVTYKV